MTARELEALVRTELNLSEVARHAPGLTRSGSCATSMRWRTRVPVDQGRRGRGGEALVLIDAPGGGGLGRRSPSPQGFEMEKDDLEMDPIAWQIGFGMVSLMIFFKDLQIVLNLPTWLGPWLAVVVRALFPGAARAPFRRRANKLS